MSQAKNLYELLEVGFLAARATSKAFKNGRWDFFDFMHFLPLIPKLGPAIRDYDQIPKELASIDDQELDQIKERFKRDFDIPDEDLEKYLEMAFMGGLFLAKLASDWLIKESK